MYYVSCKRAHEKDASALARRRVRSDPGRRRPGRQGEAREDGQRRQLGAGRSNVWIACSAMLSTARQDKPSAEASLTEGHGQGQGWV